MATTQKKMTVCFDYMQMICIRKILHSIGMLLVMCIHVLNKTHGWPSYSPTVARECLHIKCTVGLYDGNPNDLYTELEGVPNMSERGALYRVDVLI